jgi:hypothetical protein
MSVQFYFLKQAFRFCAPPISSRGLILGRIEGSCVSVLLRQCVALGVCIISLRKKEEKKVFALKIIQLIYVMI